jgi:hypothetical protein
MTEPRIDDNGKTLGDSTAQHWLDLRWGLAIIVAVFLFIGIAQSCDDQHTVVEDCQPSQQQRC